MLPSQLYSENSLKLPIFRQVYRKTISQSEGDTSGDLAPAPAGWKTVGEKGSKERKQKYNAVIVTAFVLTQNLPEQFEKLCKTVEGHFAKHSV